MAVFQETSWTATKITSGTKSSQGCRERRVSWLGSRFTRGKSHGRRAGPEVEGGAEG
ncbi:MAG: hypothetical protein ABC527_06785 [Candidatus Methanosuratincola petrocarbonis]